MVIIPILGVYIPIIRIPIEGEMTIPNIGSLDPGRYIHTLFENPMDDQLEFVGDSFCFLVMTIKPPNLSMNIVEPWVSGVATVGFGDLAPVTSWEA